LVWLRRIVGLVLALAATGGIVSFTASPRTAVTPVVAVPRPVPPARPVPLPSDPEHAIVYQRGYETGAGGRVLVERWVLAGAAFRERVTVDGVLLTDRSDGIGVDYVRRAWHAGPVRGLDDDCARSSGVLEVGRADGTVTVSGPGVAVGGHPTTVLRHHGKPAVDVWVNLDTNRAVRCRVADPGAVVFDLVWLPATDANLTQLVAVIPDGFTRVVTDRS
jgi:hypothetical protein